MKKRLELFAIVGVLVVLGYSIFVSFGDMNKITGYAVNEGVSSEFLGDSVMYLARNSAMYNFLADGASMCVIVKVDEEISYSYGISKSGSDISMTTYDAYFCTGQDEEDFIVSFVSSDALGDFVEDYSFENLMSGRAGDKYYILPSKYLEFGGNVLCVDEFKDKYCGKFMGQIDTSDAILGDLTCCVEGALEEDEKVLLAQHYSNDNYKSDEEDKEIFNLKYAAGFEDEILEEGAEEEIEPLVETPGLFSAVPPMVLIAVIAVILTGAAVGLVIFFHSKHVVDPVEHNGKLEKIQTWIHEAANHGYTEKQVRGVLGGEGWSDEDINKAIKNIDNPRSKL